MRSVSELAKLVTSGKIRVPKSLVHYVDDRAQLLDQVFTILSPSDIKGMLPDILKVWIYSLVCAAGDMAHSENTTSQHLVTTIHVCVYTGPEDEASEATLL